MNKQSIAYVPTAPRTLEEAGLPISVIANLALRAIYIHGHETIAEIADFLGVLPRIAAHIVTYFEDHDYVEALGTEGIKTSDMRYHLSVAGRQAATTALEQNHYVGPLPISLSDYRHQVKNQSLGLENLDKNKIRDGFGDLVITEEILKVLGPALISGHTCMMHGPAGNGKSVIASAIVGLFDQFIAVPHAMLIGSEVVKVFDPLIHQKAEGVGELIEQSTPKYHHFDKRWVICRRPLVVTGGELRLSMLDVSYNIIANTYDAPLQLKANGGVILLDDFGRQLADPKEILNRWVTPLEMGYDFLSVGTGGTFQVPFDAFAVFATNLNVKEVFDNATRRRIRYKVHLDSPSRVEFEEIFHMVFDGFASRDNDQIIELLYGEYYDTGEIEPARFHPKWLYDQVQNYSRYEEAEVILNKETVKLAFDNL